MLFLSALWYTHEFDSMMEWFADDYRILYCCFCLCVPSTLKRMLNSLNMCAKQMPITILPGTVDLMIITGFIFSVLLSNIILDEHNIDLFSKASYLVMIIDKPA